jgi:hypothetical protein
VSDSTGKDVTVKTCFIKWCPPDGQLIEVIRVD